MLRRSLITFHHVQLAVDREGHVRIVGCSDAQAFFAGQQARCQRDHLWRNRHAAGDLTRKLGQSGVDHLQGVEQTGVLFVGEEGLGVGDVEGEKFFVLGGGHRQGTEKERAEDGHKMGSAEDPARGPTRDSVRGGDRPPGREESRAGAQLEARGNSGRGQNGDRHGCGYGAGPKSFLQSASKP